jgi:hypothetical protein
MVFDQTVTVPAPRALTERDGARIRTDCRGVMRTRRRAQAFAIGVRAVRVKHHDPAGVQR